eukprot:gnl/TRDRNA2_/TRDRNA2_176949_c1_seq2.p2 gnl/TRDRNA2_/TRDRNA2_176949_c1~~gnl/TRDRNA2_/TRDRNA2_176949_c1_seq2.p2  ORF type:complete len:248 (-),score=35.87 gnl/TRDRNA2_/TRDRNA2_176949_c1_seq2:193-936(-)
MSPRARTLFALGAHYAYGVLFKAAFSWTAAVTGPVLQKLHDAGLIAFPEESHVGASNDTLVMISVHCRHRDVAKKGGEDANVVMQQINAILSKHSWEKCGILLASDRRLTGKVLSPLVKAKGCTLLTMTPTTPPTFKPSNHGADKGVDQDIVAMQDLYMLSLGDVLITSWGSTFSFLGQELAAVRNSPERGRAPSTIQCDTLAGVCLPEMPLKSSLQEEWWYLSLSPWPRAEMRNSHAEVCGGKNSH